MDKPKVKRIFAIGLSVISFVVILVIAIVVMGREREYTQANNLGEESVTLSDVAPEVPAKPPVVHTKTPSAVHGLYMSSWVAATPSLRTQVVAMMDTEDINSFTIDIKDATGKISFLTNDPYIEELGSEESRVDDMEGLIRSLHEKGAYIVGRISVFQDPYMTAKKPEWAIKKKSDGTVWKDRKGLSFLDPTNKAVWEYIDHIATAAYDIGFDEINFDYIRFPSDGNISDIAYPSVEGKVRSDFIRDFWAYMHETLKAKRPEIVMSADLFGMTTTQKDDLGIGQLLENALPYFDYISPMIYPSHYPKNWNGYSNPAEHPYEVIKDAMTDGVARAEALGYSSHNFRPWIQDFDLGATYTKDMVQAQIRALGELGISSYMSWDPKNTYTKGAYGSKPLASKAESQTL